MISIQRQGVTSAVVRVPVADLSVHAVVVRGEKAAAKQLAITFLTVNSTWSTGRVVATRATLDAEGKYFSVSVRHYTK